eukprot:4939489-Amphidinium_carterae.1
MVPRMGTGARRTSRAGAQSRRPSQVSSLPPPSTSALSWRLVEARCPSVTVQLLARQECTTTKSQTGGAHIRCHRFLLGSNTIAWRANFYTSIVGARQ